MKSQKTGPIVEPTLFLSTRTSEEKGALCLTVKLNSKAHKKNNCKKDLVHSL